MSDEELDPAFRSRLRQTLEQTIRAERAHPRSRGRRVALGVAAATGLVLLGGVGTTELRSPGIPPASAAGVPIDAMCASEQVHLSPSSEARIGSASSLFGVSVTVVATQAEAPRKLLAACAALWREGAIVPLISSVEMQFQSGHEAIAPESSAPLSSGIDGDALSAPRTDARPVPPLAVCALPGGAPLVVPHVGCDDVGLRAWTAEDAR